MLERRLRATRMLCMLIAVGGALGIAACGSSSSSSSSSSSGAASSAATSSAAGSASSDIVTLSKKIVADASTGLLTGPATGYVPPAQLTAMTDSGFPKPYAVTGSTKKGSVVILPCEPNNGCLRVSNVAEAVFKALGWKVTVIEPVFGANESPEQSYENQFNEAVAKKPNVLFAEAIPGGLVSQQMATAQKDGIKSIDVFMVPASGSGFTSYIPFNYNKMGEVLSAYAIAQTSGKANVLVANLEGYPNVDIPPREQLLKECSGCSSKVFGYDAAQSLNPTQLDSVYTSAVRANPSANYFIVPTLGGGATTAIQAVKSTGSTVKGLTTEALPESFQLLGSGAVDAIGYVPYDWMAYAGVDDALRLVNGQPTPAPAAWKLGAGLYTKANAPTGTVSFGALNANERQKFDYATPYATAWHLPVSKILVP
jgi:ABC-type sugar transport system substrate-binding protein